MLPRPETKDCQRACNPKQTCFNVTWTPNVDKWPFGWFNEFWAIILPTLGVQVFQNHILQTLLEAYPGAHMYFLFLGRYMRFLLCFLDDPPNLGAWVRVLYVHVGIHRVLYGYQAWGLSSCYQYWRRNGKEH